MARIYLDARNITASPSGVGRYGRELIPRLVASHPEHEFVAIRHSSNRDPLFEQTPSNYAEGYVKTPIHGPGNHLWGHRRIEGQFREHGPPDIYHDLFHVMPRCIHRVLPERAKVVVTLHDLIWIDHPVASQPTWIRGKYKQLFGHLTIPDALRKADRIISVSEATAWRATEWVDSAQIATIPHGVDEAFLEAGTNPDDLAPLPPYLRGTRYITAIGNAKEYKNLGRLVSAFSRVKKEWPELKLVLIGDCEALLPKIRALGLVDEVVLTGFVSDEMMRALLGRSQLFVFPSLVEGFGLPILEAMAMGVPVVVSDREPMRSVASDAAVAVDTTDTEAMARAMAALFDDESRLSALAEQSRSRAEQFRWEKTASRTGELYHSLLA